MGQESHFWWDWWVNFGIAISTFAAVIVALFGDWIRSKLFSPELKLELKDSFGEKTPITLQWVDANGVPQQDQRDGRCYHVTVSNIKRWPQATQVQVYLLRIEEPGPDGELKITWSGEIPIKWRLQEIHPLTRNVGPAADCDLCSVVKDKWVELSPLILPNNLISIARKRAAATMVVSLQAKANEGESEIAKFQISWDGQWEDGDIEMTHHLVVKKYIT